MSGECNFVQEITLNEMMKSKNQSSFLEQLSGLVVKEVFWDGDLLHLSFGDGWALTIYNRFIYRIGADTVSTFQLLKGAFLTQAEEFHDGAFLKFTGDQELKIDLTDDGFSGPEAMQLNAPSGEIVIWN